MNARRHLPAGPFLIAVAVAAGVVLSAPLIGQLRAWIRATFPGRFVLIVGAIGAVMLAAALVAAAIRIRENRGRRFGAIAAAIALAVVYSAWNASDNPESNAVERFHFLEYGLITWLFYRAWRPLDDLAIFLLPTLAGIIVGTAEEWLQWFIPNRVGELRDIFLNLAAIVCGLLFSAGVDPPSRFEVTLAARHPAGACCAWPQLQCWPLAAFFHSVHLGYEIADPEIGSFTSRYAPEQLPALQGAVAERWKTQPPPLVLQRISREDQYLSEGLAHVRWRNRQWAAGDFVAAWNENLILEKYFAPGTRHTDVRREAGAPMAGENSARTLKRGSHRSLAPAPTSVARTRTAFTPGREAYSGEPYWCWHSHSYQSALRRRTVRSPCRRQTFLTIGWRRRRAAASG